MFVSKDSFFNMQNISLCLEVMQNVNNCFIHICLHHLKMYISRLTSFAMKNKQKTNTLVAKGRWKNKIYSLVFSYITWLRFLTRSKNIFSKSIKYLATWSYCKASAFYRYPVKINNYIFNQLFAFRFQDLSILFLIFIAQIPRVNAMNMT